MMKRIFAATLAIAAAATVSGMPAAAQQVEELKVSSDEPYAHDLSGLRLPATLARAPRNKAVTIGGDLLDVSANYESPDRAELLSLYVYRQASGALPVWFDRARWSIEHRPNVYGKPVAAVGGPSFVPPRQQTASGLIATYTLNKNAYRSTGVAILPFGNWLVKLRYSSKTLEAASLATAMRAALAELEWPADIAPAPAAVPVTNCSTPLVTSGKSRPAQEDLRAMLMTAIVGVAAATDPADKEATAAEPRAAWCRDATALKGGGVYRPNEATDNYLIALSDAGRGVLVGPSPANSLRAESNPPAPSWNVSLVDLGATTFFQAQDRLPSPSHVMQRVIRGPVTSQVSTRGKKRNINISPGAFRNGNGKAK
ncbi:hypothetical protein LK533_15835 [Sphingomonas sp. PL-96]|uniref:hypothetical protein n=1 Tax=Sphingomonas sp. PL-96 TaxID=2887201 RepID=UPI001E2BB266|nr:hypothetical protein [Sphingomonas sp. PL-96]MCC2978132.1 hypothetical protein [Sphingomonas sp. PL-96]